MARFRFLPADREDRDAIFRTIAGFVAFGLIVLGLVWLPKAEAGISTGVQSGQVAPDFELVGLDGRRVSLHSLRGKAVFLNFWATWCPPCRAEMPDMEALKARLGGQIEIVGVNIGESPEEVRRFVRENGYTWMFLSDRTGGVSARYGVEAIPTSLFIDAEGRIVARETGMMDLEEMVYLARQAIGGGHPGDRL